MGRKRGAIDFVGDVLLWLWPFTPAWSLFGVPASMRTRTQTVNHLCIFEINSSAAFTASDLQIVGFSFEHLLGLWFLYFPFFLLSLCFNLTNYDV